MTFKSFNARHILHAHDLSSPVFVETTPFGTVWRVERADGNKAALKIYGPRGMRNEAGGFAFLASRQGHACAHIYFADEKIALLEWLDGPSLGDVSRAGEDEKSNRELVAVANSIHQTNPMVDADLPSLDLWFASLLDLQFAPHAAVTDVKLLQQAQILARKALNAQTNIRPLHGDLHHENIRWGERGYCAFDAKGVLGERAFELANGFRNPRGNQNVVYDSARIRSISKIWAAAFNVEPAHLLRWAVARCALSISWRCKERIFVADAETILLERLLAAAQ